MNTKTILTILTSLVGTAALAFDPPPVGSAAPDFSLTDAKGKTHSLADYKGKYVVLEWFNPECPFVKKHYGSSNMQNLQKEFTDKGVAWLTIDSNAPGTEGNLSPEQAEKVTTGWKPHHTALLLDTEGKAGRAYGAKNTPNMVIINPEVKVGRDGPSRRQETLKAAVAFDRRFCFCIKISPAGSLRRSPAWGAAAARVLVSVPRRNNLSVAAAYQLLPRGSRL